MPSVGLASRAMVVVVTASLVGLGLAGSTAVAQPASPAAPGHVECDPPPGTVLSAKATSDTRAWLPTSVASSYVAGPGTISRTYSSTSTVSSTVSANFEIDEGMLFASVKENFGISLTGSLSHTATWQYSLQVPKGKTAKVQQFHLGGEIGIRERIQEEKDGRTCPVKHVKSLTGNFFNSRSKADDTYCYALVTARHARPQTGKRCHNKF